MVIQFEGRISWRQTAPFHIQLELDKTEGVPRVLGKTRIQGRVIRVFRTGDWLLETVSLFASGCAWKGTHRQDLRTFTTTPSCEPRTWRLIVTAAPQNAS